MRPLPFEIPDYWTDEEALVVFEFIDGLRNQIWDHYCLQIQSAARSTRQINITMEDRDQNNEQTDFIDDEISF